MSLSIQRMGDDNLSLLQRRAIPWLLWTIWKNRNTILYADTQITLITQLQQANEEARLWHELNDAKQSIEVEGGLGNEHKRWEPPLSGFRKCNIHANWRNAKLHSGAAFITRDYSGNVLHHAREALTFSPNRLTAELRCLEWALRNMKDLAYQDIVIGSDSHDLIDAVMQPLKWPRFRILLQKIKSLCATFSSVAFETESIGSNKIVREIAKSVLRDGMFQSYLALGGPAWLHHLINREAILVSS